MITLVWQSAARWVERVCRRLRNTASNEQGYGTIYVLALTTVVVLIAMAGLAVGQALVARHRAAAAADLSAISAAARVREGATGACQEAVRVAAAQGVRVSSCRIEGEVAVVEAEVGLSGPLAALPPATARARAGPAASPLP